ncbi:MAGE-domain-containing protein [Aureobasidium pullulans]|uniref:MAGE-domain-containing protein n=1 Tax=Aureobasidium pullulans TaxID=5580 RepID=A0A4S9D2I5_AURPU|nr:MAGE-domain-containing protein [Aureobasidium pullulans]
MPPTRKRRAPANEDPEDSDAEVRQPQRRRVSDPEEDDFAGGEASIIQGDGNFDAMVKNMVRLALACEYSRTPIRRADITAKILGTNARQFKAVFTEAQTQLRGTFGMEMTELPFREKVTLAQRRAAQKSQTTQKSSGSWVLTSVLPQRFRQPEILPPPQAPTHDLESQYTGLYTFVVSLIFLNGGMLPDAKLERYLKRANVEDTAAQNSVNIMVSGQDKTEKLLRRMEKDAYIIKIKDNSSGEEAVEWIVGPRGKTEIGDTGVRGMVRQVYGEVDDPVELERMLERSLGANEAPKRREEAAPSQKKGRRRRTAARDGGDSSDESSGSN